MTGYGRSTGETELGRVTVEIRSLNHRHLDAVVRAPRNLMQLEPIVRNMVREGVSRGKVEVYLNVEDRPADFTVDVKRALDVAGSLEKVASAIGDTVRLEHVLAAGDVIETREREVDEKISSIILEAVREAIYRMLQHRYEEGSVLARDVASRMAQLIELTAAIEEIAPEVASRSRQSMMQFLNDLDLGERVEPQRVEMEVALMAQRSDIAEEITRLRTHQDSFLEALNTGGVVGRRLDFLIQEIQREINTIGSKSGLPEISRIVVDFKSGLEKVREQVQNIE